MGYWLNNPPTPQDMNSFEQWAWENWELRPEDFWNWVVWASLAAALAVTVVTVASVRLVRAIKEKRKEKKEREPKEKPIRGKRICLVKIPMTETTVDESEIITLPKGASLPIPQREGCRFLGWFYDRQYTSPIMPFDELKDETILYAKWVKEGE